MSYRTEKIQQIFVEEQAEAGTYTLETPADDTNMLPFYDVTMPAPQGEQLVRAAPGATQTQMPARPGHRTLAIAGSLDLVIPTLYSDWGNVAAWKDLLAACDLAVTETEPPVPSSVWAPSSNTSTLLSTYHNLDGLGYQGIDSKAGFQLVLEAGQVAKFVFTINGRWYDIEADFTEVELTSTFLDAYVVQLVNTITLTVDPDGTPVEKTIDVSNLTLDWNPNVRLRRGQKGTFGLKEAMTTSREPTITFDPEMGTDATDLAIVTAWEVGSHCKLEWKSAATAPYFKITAYGELSQAQTQSQDGEARHSLQLRLARETTALLEGDHELELEWAFTTP